MHRSPERQYYPVTDTDDTLTKAIGERIRARREYLELSQAEVAAKFGRTRGWAGSIENGVNTITAPDLARMADVLRCPPNYLLGDVTPAGDLADMELLALFHAIPEDARPAALGALRGISAATTKAELVDAE